MGLKHRLTKFSFRTLGSIAIIFLLLQSSAVHGEISYYLTEDFSGDLTDWELRGDDFSSGTNLAEIDNQWNLSSGYLESGGNYENLKFNVATHSLTNSYGAWRLRASIAPEGSAAGNGHWWIGLLSEPSISNITIYAINTTGVFLWVGYSDLKFNPRISSDGVDDLTQLYSIPKGLQGYNTWRNFDFLRNETHFSIYLDGQLIGKHTLNNDPEWNFKYLTIFSAIGSKAKIDDIRVTSDYTGVLAELQQTHDGTTDDEKIPLLDISIGIVGISAATGITNYTIKKKDLENKLK